MITQYLPSNMGLALSLANCFDIVLGGKNIDAELDMKQLYNIRRKRDYYRSLLWFPILIPRDPVIESLLKLYQADSDIFPISMLL